MFRCWISVDLIRIGWEQARAPYRSDNEGPTCLRSTPIISRHIHFQTQMPHLHAWNPASERHHADGSHTCNMYRSPIQTPQQLPSWFVHFFTQEDSDRQNSLYIFIDLRSFNSTKRNLNVVFCCICTHKFLLPLTFHHQDLLLMGSSLLQNTS